MRRSADLTFYCRSCSDYSFQPPTSILGGALLNCLFRGQYEWSAVNPDRIGCHLRIHRNWNYRKTRAVRELRREDKCLGMEMSPARLTASTAVYFLDLIRESAPEGKINKDLGYFGFAIICYIFVVGLHDCWENEQDGPLQDDSSCVAREPDRRNCSRCICRLHKKGGVI